MPEAEPLRWYTVNFMIVNPDGKNARTQTMHGLAHNVSEAEQLAKGAVIPPNPDCRIKTSSVAQGHKIDFAPPIDPAGVE
jgi:hypothetical protein